MDPIQSLRRDLVPLASLVVAALLLGVAYVVVVQPGLPGDEPSHLSTVRFYAHHSGLPVLGRDVSYEAQQGPIYYLIAGPLFGALEKAHGLTGFYVLRLLGLLLVPVEALLAYLLAVRLRPGDRAFILTTTAFVTLSPSLLAESATVQNEMLAVILSMLIIYLGAAAVARGRLGVRLALLLGALLGLAVLTKAIAVFLFLSLPIGLLICLGRRAAAGVGAVVAVGLAVCGWWFVRNLQLYGDATAQAALTAFHYGNNVPPIPLWKPAALLQFTYGLVGYYWSPTEFFHGNVHMPMLLRVIAVLVVATAAIGWVLWAFRAPKHPHGGARRGIGVFLLVQAALALAFYAYASARVTYFAPRSTFPAFPAYSAAVVFGGLFLAAQWRTWGRRAFAIAVLAALTAVNLSVIVGSATSPACAHRDCLIDTHIRG